MVFQEMLYTRVKAHVARFLFLRESSWKTGEKGSTHRFRGRVVLFTPSRLDPREHWAERLVSSAVQGQPVTGREWLGLTPTL
jgi:hypothetical protein